MSDVDYTRERDSSAYPAPEAQSLEHLDDRIRKACELTEHFNKWLCSDQISFAERYICGDIHTAIRRVDRGPCYYGAILEPWQRRKKADISDAHLWLDGNARWRKLNPDQPFMFPLYVETVEGKKEVVPSFVRVQRFNEAVIFQWNVEKTCAWLREARPVAPVLLCCRRSTPNEGEEEWLTE